MSNPAQQMEAIFNAALELPADQRAAYLDQACAGRAGLRQRIEELLDAEARAGAFLEKPAPEARSIPAGPFAEQGCIPAEAVGDRIGRYKLLEQIGEGGCGVVYMAEQQESVRRKVALKVIKLGMDTKQVVARFEAERQALALMDHPNIARVLDAGCTGTGRPYFVMELVNGIPITRYCDENTLSTEQRLRLFIQVCQAVQHAHQKGIIHRDLKPSNILVTVNDGVPVPKVIDFGIAKATQGRLTDHTLFTAFEQFVGTPAYMSPEQAMMTSLDIDTRSDIYSLGVLLYGLLTGQTPFDTKELLAAGLDGMRRTIREKEPPRPSTTLSTMLAGELATVAKSRQAEPLKLIHQTRGDLDWIVMKCLEKDRTGRYETANGLAMDVQRYLANEPVVARPPNKLYLFRKLVSRNRLAFTATAVVVVALLAGLGLSTWSFYEEKAAHRQAMEAREQTYTNFQIARDTVDQMLTRVVTDSAGEPRMVQLRRALLGDALKFYKQFVQQKPVDPAMRYDLARAYMRVGDVYDWLGEYQKALAPFEQALLILSELARQYSAEPRYRVDLVEAYSRVGFSKQWLGRDFEDIASARSKVGLCEDLRRDFPAVPDYLYLAATAHVGLGNALEGVAPKESLNELRQALELYESHRSRFPNVPEDRAKLAHIRHWLGFALQRNGRYDEAEHEYRQSMELRTQLLREQPQDLGLQDELASLKAYLGNLLARTGRGAKAEELLQEAIAVNEQGLKDQIRHAESARRAGIVHRDLGYLLLAMNRTTEAEKNLRRAVELHSGLSQDLVDVPHYREALAFDLYALGLLLEATRRSGEATEAFRKAIELFEQASAENPQSLFLPLWLGWRLATCPAQFRDPPRALALAQQAIQRAPENGDSWGLLGTAQYRAGQPAAAIESFRKALELTDGGEPEQWFFLALANWQNENHQQAWQWYNKAVDWIEKNHPANEELERFRAEAAAILRPEK